MFISSITVQKDSEVYYTPESAIRYHKHLNILKTVSKIAIEAFAFMISLAMLSFVRVSLTMTPGLAFAAIGITAVFFAAVTYIVNMNFK